MRYTESTYVWTIGKQGKQKTKKTKLFNETVVIFTALLPFDNKVPTYEVAYIIETMTYGWLLIRRVIGDRTQTFDLFVCSSQYQLGHL